MTQRIYAYFDADELALFDRDMADIARMYSSQEQDNLIQIWTGTEFSGTQIQGVIDKSIKLTAGQKLPPDDSRILATDKAQALLHLGFYKNDMGGRTYGGRLLDSHGIGMDVIRPEDYFGDLSTFTIWDQPTLGWTAMPAALFEVRAWAERADPDTNAFGPPPMAEIVTIDANDDKWALLLLGVMELSNSTDLYAFHWQTNRKPRPPAVLENQIRVGDIGLSRFGPLYFEWETPYATGLEFRGDVGYVPVVSPKPWGLCFFTDKRALALPRNRPRAA